MSGKWPIAGCYFKHCNAHVIPQWEILKIANSIYMLLSHKNVLKYSKVYKKECTCTCTCTSTEEIECTCTCSVQAHFTL